MRSNLEALLRDPNNHIDSSPREPRFVLVPRAGLGKPWSASNANKPASSWPLKQGPKKWSKHGCDKGTLTVATAVIFHIDHVSPPVSPFIRFSPLSLRPGVVGVCFEVPG